VEDLKRRLSATTREEEVRAAVLSHLKGRAEVCLQREARQHLQAGLRWLDEGIDARKTWQVTVDFLGFCYQSSLLLRTWRCWLLLKWLRTMRRGG